MERRFILSDPRDNVVTLLENASSGDVLRFPDKEIVLLQDVPFAHKAALSDIPEGAGVFKYGERIGYALCGIKKGEWVHVHNLGCDTLKKGSYDPSAEKGTHGLASDAAAEASRTTFMGYRRPDGKVVVRNYVAIIPSVLCADTAARMIARQVPGCVALTHGVGCGQYGYDAEITARTLKAMGTHPNIYAAVVLGLGCERFQSSELYEAIKASGKPAAHIVIQEEGDVFKTVEKGVEAARRFAEEASGIKREPCSVSELTIATKCGGTDATSGLAANPAVGSCCDRIVSLGGSGIISEVGELLNTEHIFMRRAESPEVSEKIGRTFCDYRDYLRQHCDPRYEKRNDLVTPGNEDGGVTNVVEKALGGVVKSGSSKFADVLEYAVPPEEGRHGFFLMNYGNHDGEVVTGMIGCGAQICLFTTGRGTPTGFPFVPVIKITGNEETYKRMKLNMDFDASPVIRGEASVEELGGELFEKLLAVAEGQQTVAEMLGADELFCIARHS